MGMKPGDAFNIFLAQIELRNDLPFTITTNPKRLLSTAEQEGKVWEDALGEYRNPPRRGLGGGFWAGGQAASRSDTGLSTARKCPGFGGCGALASQVPGDWGRSGHWQTPVGFPSAPQ